MRLEGEGVVLRLPRPDDAAALARGFAEDPRLGELVGLEPDQENEAFLRAEIEEDAKMRDERKAFWFTIARPDDEVIGQIGLVGIGWPNRRAGIAVWLLPGARGTGAAREALDLIVRWAQSELELHRIELHTFPENTPMQACAEAAGFAREGVLRDYSFERGQYRDNVVYARLPG